MKRFALAAAILGIAFAVPASAQQPVAIGSLPQGSLGYSIASAMAKVATESGGVETRAVGLGGSSVYIPQINAGEMEFGTSNTFESIFATQGTGNFEGRPNPNLRVAAALVPFTVGLMVQDGSDIREITDLEGKPFPTGYARMRLVGIMQEAIFDALGMDESNLDPVPVPNFVKGAELLAEGAVAGVLLAPGSGVVTKTHAQTPIRFLSIPDTPEVAESIAAALPSTYLTVVEPNPRLAGIVEPTTLLGYQYTLITHADVSDDTVYKVVKALHENQEALAAAHGIFNRFDPSKMAVDLPGAEYHPGAIRYYEEQGLWPPKS